jgi:hypothetical protein
MSQRINGSGYVLIDRQFLPNTAFVQYAAVLFDEDPYFDAYRF